MYATVRRPSSNGTKKQLLCVQEDRKELSPHPSRRVSPRQHFKTNSDDMAYMLRKRLTAARQRIVACRTNYTCYICHELAPPCWQFDHVIPLHLGGTNAMDNFALVCPNCHAMKTQRESMELADQRIVEKMEREETYPVGKSNGHFVSPYFDKTHPKYLHQFVLRPTNKIEI